MIIADVISKTRDLVWSKLSKLIDGARNLARQHQDSPLEFLQAYPWKDSIPVDVQFSQEDYRRMNMEFDQRGCFGRIVLALAVLDKYFIYTDVKLAEVISDELARRMKILLGRETNPQTRRELAAELLMYEEPHLVLMVDGQQFDPLSSLVKGLEHPQVLVHDGNPWEMVQAALVIEESLSNSNMIARNIHLQRAELYCPKMQLLIETQASAFVGFGHPEAKELCLKALETRTSARMLWVLWRQFGDDRILREYPREVVDLLDDQYQALMERGAK